MNRKIRAAAALGLAWTLAAAWAHEDHAPATQAPKNAPAVTDVPAKKTAPDARTYFTDLELLTQDGKKVRFYSDVLEGQTVLINTIYTNCQDACPLITQKLNEVRAQIPDRFGKGIRFVSISSDPVRDTPEALKNFAKKQHADMSGWVFLTGKKENVDHILKKLGQYSDDLQDHSTLLIAGNVPAKRWSKISPEALPVAIAERLKMLDDPTRTPFIPSPGAK